MILAIFLEIFLAQGDSFGVNSNMEDGISDAHNSINGGKFKEDFK